MSYQITLPPSDLEVSAYKFIEELQRVRIKTKVMHPSDIELARNLIISVQTSISCIEEEIKEFKIRLKITDN